MKTNFSILLTTEGTYPCYRGGVSVWCHQLIEQLPDLEFHVFAIVHSPSQPLLFSPPENVVSCKILPLWGTEEPGLMDGLFSETYRRKLRTDSTAIRRYFCEPFDRTVRSFLQPDSPSEKLAEGLLAMHAYFREYDYAQTMTSPESWDIFLRVCSASFPCGDQLNLEEATDCMRWLRRYLAVVSVQYPASDIVHASMAGLGGIPGVLQKLSNGARFLLSEHGIHLRELYIQLWRTEYSDRCKRFLIALNDAVVRMNYYYADAMTALCGFNQRWQLRLGADPDKLQVVPNGVDPERFRPRQRSPTNHPTVLTMARILPLKGVDVLLRAAILVRKELPTVLFRIMGDAADEAYFKQCLEIVRSHDLASSIEFGQTNDPTIYNEADVFCLPSISEGMPYSVLEAMFSGCPVVATDVGGVAELLGGTGLLVKPRDSEALAQALLELLRPGSKAAARRAALAVAALGRAREHYTLPQITQHFRQIYRGLLDESQPETARERQAETLVLSSA